MRVKYEGIIYDIALHAKSPQAIRIYKKMHAKWHKQGRKLNNLAKEVTGT